MMCNQTTFSETKPQAMIVFNRDLCSDPAFTGNREWLVTNGIGGYASGTISFTLTRRYHGLLIASLTPPVGRTLLVAKFDEVVTYDGQAYPMFANQWEGGSVELEGIRYLERFHLEGTIPVWTYGFADALLEKRIWMVNGENTTYVRYDLRRASQSMSLSAKALVNCRDHHGNTTPGQISLVVEPVENGLKVSSVKAAVSFYLYFQPGVMPQTEWYPGFFLKRESQRGLNPIDSHLHVGSLDVALQVGEPVTVAFSTASNLDLDGKSALASRYAYEKALITQETVIDMPAGIRQLVLAADQFIVSRDTKGEARGRTIIAGYPWFADWGRDTMISLPGLTLETHHTEAARDILNTFSLYVDQGMLPNTFPERGQRPEYNTVDATLWYLEALRAYVASTGDTNTLQDLYPVLEEIIDWHMQGTRFQIQVDPSDGLLHAGEPGVQLTWMDAKIGEWVVTPRIGKPVEVNALWFNALCVMSDFASRLGVDGGEYRQQSKLVKDSFSRFWNRKSGFCYDVIDGPTGDDPALRPNQLFAISLPHSPLTSAQQKAVVEICLLKLYAPYGMRSLDPAHPAYSSHYGGDQRQRDAAYHQGTVWGWLMGPFVTAHLRVYQNPDLAEELLLPLINQIASHGVGNLSEIFEADPPFLPRGCIAQAWTVAETLRAWSAIQTFRQTHYYLPTA